MRVDLFAADGRTGGAGRGAQALGRRGGAQPPGRLAGRGGHTPRDVPGGGAACRVRTGWGPANFAILRRFALDWLNTLRGKDEPLPGVISRLLCGFAVAAAMEDAAMAAV